MVALLVKHSTTNTETESSNLATVWHQDKRENGKENQICEFYGQWVVLAQITKPPSTDQEFDFSNPATAWNQVKVTEKTSFVSCMASGIS